MRHALGTGTCNVSINLPLDERAVLGRTAFAHGSRSVGDFLRHLILLGLESEDHAAADRVREVRRRYYGALMLAVFASALACGERMDLRRTGTRTEVRREEAV